MKPPDVFARAWRAKHHLGRAFWHLGRALITLWFLIVTLFAYLLAIAWVIEHGNWTWFK